MAPQARQGFGPSIWAADGVTLDGDRLTMTGWVARRERSTPITASVNGRRVTEFAEGGARPDIGALLPFIPGSRRAGFRASTALSDAELRGERAVDIELVDSRTLTPLCPWQTVSWLPEHVEQAPLPDGPRIRRVHGAPDSGAFRLVGYSNFRKIDRLLRTVVGQPLQSFPRVLDWGCGCGRLMRYLSTLNGVQLTGADVDRDNLAWCRQHLLGPSYVELPLHPPTTLESGAFDLVVGISIFTHLTESVQFEWLEELHRASAPGAVLLMSIHGPAVHAIAGGGSLCGDVAGAGFIDGRSYDLDEVLDDKNYYRTTHHSHAYVRATWSRWFDIVDILPACIGNMQDLVVMKRKA
jgi:SAM-dependent methyltransferase